MKTSQKASSLAFCGLALVVIAGCTSQDPDLHQHQKMVKEKPMAERKVGQGTWVTDRIGRRHYVWPEEEQSPE